MTPQQREALKQALDQHSLKMAVKDAAPEDVAALPQDFAVPSYNENNKPLYDNQLFPAVNSVDDLVARGYATPDGQVTENGQMALSLRKVGALKEDYTLNDTGKVLLASQDDILKEENIDLYREYKRLELDEAPDVGIWDMAKGIASDLVKGANAIAENELGGIKDIASSQAFGGAFDQYGAEQLTPEKRAESRIKTEEAAKDLFVSSAGLARAAATEIDKVAAKTMWDGMMQDYQVSYLEQKYDRDLADMEKVNTAEVADELAKVIGINTQIAEGRQQAEELIGPEATQKAIEEGRAAGLALSVVNPLAPEALVARTAFGAARTGVSAAFKPISRKLLESEAKAAQALQASQRVTGLQGNLAQVNYLAQKAEHEAIFAERQADKYSKLGLSNRANDARTFADKLRTKGLEAGAKSQGLTDEIARASEEAQKLAQDAAVADKINFIAQRAREIPGLPIQAIGGLIEGTGNAMIGIDKGLSKLASKIGADKAYNAMNKITTLSGIGGVGMASGFGPVAFIPAAIKTAWSTAPFLKGAGHFVRMIGKETANARELIPFWQRVANYETLGATQRSIAHLMDTSTLGSRITGLAGDVAKGVAASYPIDLAFEWISEGGEMDINTLKQAAAETVVFGGGGALGGITAGSKERIKKLQRGSSLNFYRNIKDGGQRVAFNALNDGMKRSVGTYASAFPNLNIRFTDQGGGAFDPASNTAFINPMSRNPLKPLLAHEINHYILIRNQMEGGISAALVGDGVQTGGLLRGKDGKLDENFLAFKEEYTQRLEAQHNRQINQKIAAGEKIPAKQRQFIAPTDNDIAIEYFVDSMADDMMEMAETGELGKQAGRMLVNRKMQAFGNAILQKAPIIKDFFYKLGGVTDQNGRAVYGNGLLAEGIREIPQMKKLFRQMISESAGRPMHVAKVTKGESEGHTIPITGKNDPILDEMTSMYESDENGVPLRDKNGDRIPLSDETEKLRSSSGLLLLEDQENRLKRGETLEDGELRFNPEENAWTGEYLTDRQIQILIASGRFNNAQLRQLEMLNGAAQENTGRRFLVFNQPATKKRKGKRLDYGTLGISMREIVPYGIKITKDGNILVRLMSVQQLHANAFEKATSKRGQSLYRGDAEAILRDVNQVIENHGRNEPTDAYFKREYGTEWEVRKNFINTVFGNVGKGQKDINPLLASEKAKNAVVKTYRIDRINKATELEGRTKLPYQNHLVKVNFMPEGEPILDANGEPKDLRYTPRYEEQMPEQRQMPEVSTEESKNWFKQNRSNFIHVNIRGNEIDPTRDFTGWVLPVGRDAVPDANVMNTRYGNVGKQVVLVPKEFVTNSKYNPDKIKPGFRPSPEQIGTITEESINKNGTIDWSKVFAKPTEPTPAPSQMFMPEMPNAPQDTGFRSITEQGKEAIGGNYKSVAPGSILGTMRFMPEAENDRILANFPLGEDEKKKLEGKAGFAFVSDWSDSNRPYITKNGREIDVLMGGVGYTYHPEVIGKGGWAGSFSGLTNRVLNKINETDGIGLVVAGGRDSTASSRSFSIAALEEIKDDISNGTVSKSAIDNIIKNNAERLLGLKNIKSLGDYEKLVMLERGGSGLTFEQRADMIKAINSHENKKSFGISNWNDILKKYEMQNGIFVPGQIMSVVQFKKNAPLMKASDLNIKGHKSYEAVIQGKPIGMLKEKVMIGDFFKDFFTSEGTLPASYTRKVQTKMPSFKYGEGSAVLKETAKSIANAAKLK